MQNSMFNNHELVVEKLENSIRHTELFYWQTTVLTISFSLFVIVRVLNPKKTQQVFASLISIQIAKELFREDYKLNKRVTFILSIVFILIFAFLLQIINTYFGLILLETSDFVQYLFFIGLIIAMYLVKFSFSSILAHISNNDDIEKEYRFTTIVFNQVFALIILPIVILLQYSQVPTGILIYTSIGLVLTFYFFRLYRGFIISALEQNLGFMYIFLYFCALEILPLLILIKFLLINF
jgi:MFS family permease